MIDHRASRAAMLLVEARRSGKGLAEIPADCRPQSEAEAYAIQDAVAQRVGPIKGWKTGAPGPDAEAAYALIYGPAVPGWQSLGLDLGRPPIKVSFDGKVAAETTGNSGGDPLRLLTALANHCTTRTGGLRAGDMITTGSITGVSFAKPGAVVVGDFGRLGTVRLEFPL